ncbi:MULTISPECIES: mannose-1-phosphate guanylyltransferase [Apibacter]|uniref:mannose-1-phosphate guanylyltransferase n=1 Tax=Apibacter TaxID=1778601 RepID=UPI00132ABA8F|nr:MULTISPECIES: sugar phosphate nucleotidyltransferase [Apibacter]MCX8676772.1 mannose-1-phosphate guanylyltransferase [Apibacter sp. B3919]MXO24845.1 mannose-1-phosphate guanylyltransferase [Apibacter sp. B3924]MXO26089.1 mannose-1-phosphate guanylyltransferase [Apibacter sp. B3813]MXO28040.1 mannose-1-phosphate guanylyltransferase [Apibacter sp. B3913]MXO29600.1 mannose-1-phosphate guanylyltransferase [Apibacter sp. B3912]
MTKNKNYYCVIMAGGIGSRFWPISTTKFPKQFHDILGTGKTLIQQTFERLSKIILKENIFVITNQEYVDLTLSQLPDISKNQIIGEPKMMNTAACNIYMAEKIHKLNPDASIIVAPSDHLIINENQFVTNVLNALKHASQDNILVTLGIAPTRPDTGYGYIEYVKEGKEGLYQVKSFKEKPNLETAKEFLKSKNFLWNSGIFIWSSRSILSSYQKYLPDMYRSFESIIPEYNTDKEPEAVEKIYSKIEKISIDYGILEKSDNVWVIPSTFGWSDLGTWSALYENFNKNEEGNAVHGNNIYTYDTSNTIIKTDLSNKIYIIDGLTDFIIVDTSEALLVCPRNNDQKIKDYLENIKKLEESKKSSKE